MMLTSADAERVRGVIIVGMADYRRLSFHHPLPRLKSKQKYKRSDKLSVGGSAIEATPDAT